MSESSTSERRAPEESLASYRPVSASAVIAVLVALVSLVAFWHPGLAVVPLAGVLIAAFALWRISHSGGTLIGRPLALVGLIVSVACLCAAPTYFVLQAWSTRRAAREAAEHWLDTLRRGEVDDAMAQIPGVQLLLTDLDPSISGGVVEGPPEKPKELFLQRMPAAKWMVDHSDAQLRFAGIHEHLRGRRNESMALEYDAYGGPNASEPKTRVIRFGLSRRIGGLAATGRWTVDGAKFVDATQAANVPSP